MAADVLNDLEQVRCANENRLRQLTDTGELGHGLTVDHPDVKRLAGLVDGLVVAEHQAVLNLRRAMRAHPLGPWVASAPGVGEKQAARLLAVVGDPYWNVLHDRPRTVSELWAYAGFHVLRTGDHVHLDAHDPSVPGVAPKRQRGQRSNWSEDARKRAWLIAASCVKQPPGTRYRDVYDVTRARYVDVLHVVECVRCGPSGKPAQPGSVLSLGHQHARGLRMIAKTVLRDLWVEARRLHGVPETN